jgi:hypothetical protein
VPIAGPDGKRSAEIADPTSEMAERALKGTSAWIESSGVTEKVNDLGLYGLVANDNPNAPGAEEKVSPSRAGRLRFCPVSARFADAPRSAIINV